jgi:hypothetical protein
MEAVASEQNILDKKKMSEYPGAIKYAGTSWKSQKLIVIYRTKTCAAARARRCSGGSEKSVLRVRTAAQNAYRRNQTHQKAF